MAAKPFEDKVVCADCGGDIRQDADGNWDHATGGKDHHLRNVESNIDRANRINQKRGWGKDENGNFTVRPARTASPTRKVISSSEAVAAGKKKAAAKPRKKAAPYVKRAPKLTERTGVLTYPEAPAVVRKKDTKDGSAVAGEVLQPGQEKSKEKLAPGWKGYVTPAGEATSDWSESVEAANMPKADRDVRAKGAKHLEKDHPWVTTSDPMDPNSDDVEGAVFTGLPSASVTASSSGKQTIWYDRLKQMATNLAHWHKSQFDPGDEYEYQVHQNRPTNTNAILNQREIDQTSPFIVRRRLRYCEKCAPTEPVMIGKSKHWYGPAQTMFKSMTGRLKANSKQQFVRPEPTALDPESAPWQKRPGEFTRHPGLASTPLLNSLDSLMKTAEQTRVDAFLEGSGNRLAKPTPTDLVKANTKARK
jgi:hypothetical protein